VQDHTWEIKEWGWNIDWVNMDMTKSGFKRMTLKTFRNAWFQIYQKQKDLLRLEVHLTPTDLSLTDVMRIFAEMKDVAEGYRKKPLDWGDPAYR